MKYLHWISDNIFFVISLFFLMFIPLYPKLPLIGVTHTFVYIRIEDFLVAVTVITYAILLLRKKVTFQTPLTIPILLYWLVGFVATLWGIFFVFPHIANVFPKNAWLFYFRHIEYMSLFFVAYNGMKNKKYVPHMIGVLVITLVLVVAYGTGQRFFPQFFPAFSTMNEEFAKGIPLTLSALGRIQSTFAGHYDLAAYLVMIIPLVGSLIFGIKKRWMKLVLLLIALSSVMVLLMTASRTSFAMYLVATMFMLILQKQKKWIIPVIILSLLLLRSFTGIYSRYTATLSQVNVVVDARTGKVIGNAQQGADGSLTVSNVQSTGESLQSGSVYTPSQGQVSTASSVTVKTDRGGAKSIDIKNLQGNFIVQKAQALDVSITTRLQAEWPNAIKAFQRNYLLGSGYSAITLATDGNYFRILGETGLLGFLSFGFIFLVFAVYVYELLPKITSEISRSFVLGVCAAIFGLALNAILIDVFEASKVAFVLWLLMGFAVGILHQYDKQHVNITDKLRTLFSSSPAIITYFFIATSILFSQMLNNFFVADDFTWLRWVGDCNTAAGTQCASVVNTLSNYILHSENFFYRPGTKTFFYFMYKLTWLNPSLYHLTSLFLHLLITTLIFLLSEKILKSRLFAFLAAAMFLVLSVHAETILWISSVGHLFATFFGLVALWLFILWRERNNNIFFFLSLVSVFIAPLFHEYGVFATLLIIIFDLVSQDKTLLWKKFSSYTCYLFFILPVSMYFLMKIISHSYWAAGDYRYNLLKLPFNAIGNALGYIGMTLVGNPFLPIYDSLRIQGREQIYIPLLGIILVVLGAILFYFMLYKFMKQAEKKIMWQCAVFFFIPLLPFLGLGNIAPRYIYLASFGIILFLVFLMQLLYTHIGKKLQSIALGIGVLLAVLFCGYHINQLNNANNDWQKAGSVTDNVIQYMNEEYEAVYPITRPEFYFVNVPIRYGQAWIFPVGLPDALWFVYKDKVIQTHQVATVNDAIDQSKKETNTRIYEFDKNYTLSTYQTVHE